MQRVRIHRGIARLKNTDLFYLDTKTDGPAILCLHGRWGRAETWCDLIERYGAAYRVIAPDQRGHGLSGKPISKYTAEEMVQDILELLDFLELESVILVGHSMGGRIAGYFAALHPPLVRALAILDKSARGPAPVSAPPLEHLPAVDPLTKDWPLPFASRKEASDFIRQAMDSELGQEYFMNSLTETVEGYRMMFSPQAMAANIAYERDWFHLLVQIECPTLLVRAKGCGAVSDEDFSQMLSLIRDCRALDVKTADHNVHLANKEEFYRCFDGFLAEI